MGQLGATDCDAALRGSHCGAQRRPRAVAQSGDELAHRRCGAGRDHPACRGTPLPVFRMKTVVHVSADYPDSFAPNKTAAVANLVAGAPGLRHVVYSLNRVAGLSGIAATQFDTDRFCVVYHAPPKGLLLRTRLNDVADWI